MSTPKVHGGSQDVNTQQNSSMQRQDILFGKSLQVGNFMRHGKFGKEKYNWRILHNNNVSNPNILENYDEVSPSEGEIVYLFRFNGKKA